MILFDNYFRWTTAKNWLHQKKVITLGSCHHRGCLREKLKSNERKWLFNGLFGEVADMMEFLAGNGANVKI